VGSYAEESPLKEKSGCSLKHYLNDCLKSLAIKRSACRRAEALIAALTLTEKVPQMLHNAPAIDRLGISAYNWWNEYSHGVARARLWHPA
jgi:beta-glucosidase-like glycosyl hydrolase